MPISKDHIEVGFSECLFEDDDNLFILEGRIDLLAKNAGIEMVVDHKFQFRASSLYKRLVQFRNYALVSKKLLLCVNYIRLTKKTDDTTFVRDPVNFTVPEHIAWRNELIRIFLRIKQSIQTNSFEKNYASCPGRYGYECQFTNLCEASPEVRDLKEHSLYQIKPREWRPW